MAIFFRIAAAVLAACTLTLGGNIRPAGVAVMLPGMHAGHAFKMAAEHRYLAVSQAVFQERKEPFEGPEMGHGPLARSARAAARETGVPAGLLWAIAMQESSLHPWTVSVAGRPRYFPDLQTAREFLDRLPRGANFDIGPMQINSFWVRRLNVNATSLLDPPTNFRIAATILRTEFRRHGKNWKALAAYHAGSSRLTPRGREYARKVLDLYQGM